MGCSPDATDIRDASLYDYIKLDVTAVSKPPAQDWVRVDCMIRDIYQLLDMGSSGAYSIHGSFQFPSEAAGS
jgi:hypothetical protein